MMSDPGWDPISNTWLTTSVNAFVERARETASAAFIPAVPLTAGSTENGARARFAAPTTFFSSMPSNAKSDSAQ